MLRYLIEVVQGSLVAALLLALLFAAGRLSATQPSAPGAPSGTPLRPGRAWLLRGCAAGTAGAVVLAALKHATALVNREYVNLVVLPVALVLCTLFLVLLWRAAPTPPRRQVLRLAVPAALAGVLVLHALPDVLLLPTEFALPGESVIGSAVLLKLLGYLAGLTVVALCAFAVHRVSAACPPRLLRAVTTAAFAITMADLAISVVQILIARAILPSQRWLFTVVVWAINHQTWFLLAVLAVTAVLPVVAWRSSRRPPTDYANPAELRAQRAEALSRRRFCEIALATSALAVLSLTAVRAWDEREPVLSEAEPVDVQGDQVAIPLTDVDDGHLHRFAYAAADGTEVRFIVIKKNDVAFGVGLDACAICGPTGYYESGGKVICKLCDVAMNIPTIGFAGGCNPVPLAHTLGNGNLLVRVADLEDASSVFA